MAHVHELLHGEESAVFADAGYTGECKRLEIIEAIRSGDIRGDIDWHVAQRHSVVKTTSW
jgi:IS5 family transposase